MVVKLRVIFCLKCACFIVNILSYYLQRLCEFKKNMKAFKILNFFVTRAYVTRTIHYFDDKLYRVINSSVL